MRRLLLCACISYGLFAPVMGRDDKCCGVLEQAQNASVHACKRVPEPPMTDPMKLGQGGNKSFCKEHIEEHMICCALKLDWQQKTKLTPDTFTELRRECGCDLATGHDSAQPASSAARVQPNALCQQSGNKVTCSHRTMQINGRNVHYQVPEGTAPSGGWPTAIIFHGWNLYAENSWSASKNDAYGVYNKALLVQNLLGSGIAVITPNAVKPGGYWYTNISPYQYGTWAQWNSSSPDASLLTQIFNKMSGWGMNINKLHCAGFSSGAYMTARMVVNYDVCKTLSINSGSYYYCSGAECPTPTSVYDDVLKTEVPTLFLQGTNDQIVPDRTQEAYYSKLQSLGRTTNRVTQRGAGHQWIDQAPTAIVDWIQKHSADHITV